jgi:hypothetical protein
MTRLTAFAWWRLSAVAWWRQSLSRARELGAWSLMATRAVVPHAGADRPVPCDRAVAADRRADRRGHAVDRLLSAGRSCGTASPLAGNDHAHLVVDLVKADGRVANIQPRPAPRPQAGFEPAISTC